MAIGEYLGAGSGVTKGLYHLNGNANDSSGNSANGTATNITWVGGILGSGSASFNGSTSKISCGNINDENGSTAFTMSCWVNFSSVSANQMIFGKQLNSGNFNGYMLWGQLLATPTRFRINMSLVSSSTSAHLIEVITPDNELTTGVWYNLIMTYDGSKTAAGTKIYINSVLKSSTATDTLGTDSITSTADFGIGSRNSGNLPINGLIDECIKESGVAWSQSKINKYYAYAKGRFGIL